jgi:hypothetical protein
MSFLGRFLVEQGAISEEQLEDGLRFQRENNRRIGEVAVERGLLTPAHVREICQRQQDDSRLFGDIAVGDRRLTRKSLDNLLFFQKIQHTYLGEALLVREHISRDQYQQLMGRYYALRGKGRVSLRYLQDFYAENRVLEILDAALGRVIRRYVGEVLAVSAIGGDMDVAHFSHWGMLTGVVLGDRHLAAWIGLSTSLADKIVTAVPGPETVPGLDAFFFMVLRYFGDMLRDASLVFDEGCLERDKAFAIPFEDGLTVRCQTPSGEVGLGFWLEEAKS